MDSQTRGSLNTSPSEDGPFSIRKIKKDIYKIIEKQLKRIQSKY